MPIDLNAARQAAAEARTEWQRSEDERNETDERSSGRGNSAESAHAASAAGAPGWPDPFGAEAYHGLAGEIVRAIEPESEADPASLLLQFLSAFGNVLGRGPYIQIEGDRHHPQIWGVLVGTTSKARKGTSWGRIRQLLELAEEEWLRDRVVSGMSSGEGLIWQVRDPIIKRERDKKTRQMEEVVVDPGVDDKRLFVLEPEFASVLRHFERQGNTLSGTLRCMWDTGDVRALTKHSPARTTGSLISIVGHITLDELRRYLTRTEAGNGLANRFLFAMVQRSKKLPFGGGPVDLTSLGEEIGHKLKVAGQRKDKRVYWTDAGREIWRDAYDQLSEGAPGLFGAVTSRAEAQTLRLALTYALLDGTAFLEPVHLQAALEVWRYCEESAQYIFGSSVGDPVADEILRVLIARKPEGLSRTDISSIFKRNREGGEIQRALDVLLERGLVRSEKLARGAGRPAELWYAL